MIIQLLTIGGRRIFRELPNTIKNTNDFRKWICSNIIDDTYDNYNTNNTNKIDDTQANYKINMSNNTPGVGADIMIRVDGRPLSDKIIYNWQQSYNKTITLGPNMEYMKENIKKVKYVEGCDIDMKNVEWSMRVRGGFIMDVITAVIAIFKFMLFIPKLILWIGSLILWNIKVLIFLINVTFQVLSEDGLMGLIKLIISEIVLLPVKLFSYVAGNVVNVLGKQTLYGIWGADNARGSTMNKLGSSGEPSDIIDGKCDGEHRCYIAPDGSVPFSVVVVTVLCPPVGIFMEYGISGWLKILVCFILTLMLYFPGLIYALMLLYC